MQIYLEKNNIQTRVIFTGNILKQPGFRRIICKKDKTDQQEFKQSKLLNLYN